VTNLNGGDTKFDPEFNSYAWVSPLSRQVGLERQIYASNSNENTYTDLWSNRFYGYGRLIDTFINTEIPIRIKPMNVYYHAYALEKLATMKAVLNILDYSERCEICPIMASRFSTLVQGFFSTRISQEEENLWTVSNRQALQTIRFDNATLRGVDFSRSEGVIGQRHHQGSLYIYLDEKIEPATVAVKEIDESASEPIEETPYLISGRWRVWNLEREESRISFDCLGFGEGDFRFSVPTDGLYRATIKPYGEMIGRSRKFRSEEYLLHLQLPAIATGGATMQIERIDE